jgi:glycosyltransferase involved in cell wall biosynthesis
MPLIRQRAQWNPVIAQWCLPPSRVGHVDLFHWSDTVFFHLPGRLHVATVHDTIPLTHPEWCTPEQSAYHSRHLRTVASHAARIIAVSESTRQDVIGALGVDADRIDVVPLGVSERFTQHASGPGLTALRHRYGLGNGSYVLYAGNTRPHKNLPRLIASVRAVMDAGSVPDLRLVLVGGLPQRDSPEVRAIESHRLGDRVAWLGRVPADDLPILMSGAAAVACVSLYEGFGLPALEAMAAGAPVVASDRSSFPEVVGDAGLLVDPYSERDIAQAVRRICTDPALAAQLRAKGMRRAQSFSWDRTARLTEESYRRAAACTGGRVG